MFDIITQPIETAFAWFGYALLFGAFIVTLLVIGLLLAVPIGLKLLGVAFAKTITTELVKVVKENQPHTTILKEWGTSYLKAIK
jgi:hypothetical protein